MNRKQLKKRVSTPPPVNGGPSLNYALRLTAEQRAGLDAMKADIGCPFNEFIIRALVASLTKKGYLKGDAKPESRRARELKL